jgi:hypothetical protein
MTAMTGGRALVEMLQAGRGVETALAAPSPRERCTGWGEGAGAGGSTHRNPL